jgi:hypothetical protein
LPAILFLPVACRQYPAAVGGDLECCGPDGKLIARLREDADGFALEHVLVTLEHPEPLDVHVELSGGG